MISSENNIYGSNSVPEISTTNFAAFTLNFIQDDLIAEMIQRSNLRNDFFVISLLIRGSGKIRINLKEFSLKKNDLLIIPPDVTKDNIELSSDAVLKVIAYSSEFLVPLPLPDNFWEISDYFSAKNIPVWSLDSKAVKSIISMVDQLAKWNNHNTIHPYKSEILNYTFMIFILELAAIAPRYSQKSNQRFSRKELLTIDFYALAKKHFRTKRALQFYADLLFVTPKYLTETIKEVSGQTAGDVIDSFTLQEARVQLKTTSKTISEIAGELNFSEQSSFGKFFKRLTGMSPRDYRQSK